MKKDSTIHVRGLQMMDPEEETGTNRDRCPRTVLLSKWKPLSSL